MATRDAAAAVRFEHTADVVDVVNMCGRALCVPIGAQALDGMPDVKRIREGPFGSFPHIALMPDAKCAYTLSCRPAQAGALALTDWANVGLELARMPCVRGASPLSAALNEALEARLLLDKPALLVAENLEAASAVAAAVQRAGARRVRVATPVLGACVVGRVSGRRCADAKRCTRCSTVLEWALPHDG